MPSQYSCLAIVRSIYTQFGQPIGCPHPHHQLTSAALGIIVAFIPPPTPTLILLHQQASPQTPPTSSSSDTIGVGGGGWVLVLLAAAAACWYWNDWMIIHFHQHQQQWWRVSRRRRSLWWWIMLVLVEMLCLVLLDEQQWTYHGRRCIKNSVFSAAFLVRGRVRPQGGRAVFIVVGSHCIALFTVFLDLRWNVPTVIFVAAFYFTVFREFDRRENEAAFIVLIKTMVLIDAACKELSNGGHIIFWSNLDLGIENPACRLDLQSADGFLALFLTPSFEQKSSNRADYTPNR